ncbi:hypothetical protein VTI74DRAFT_8938 [Chaetomium olivicolor]
MVTLEQMRASNLRIPGCLPAGLVAVFAGGTSGIGETTMKQFAKHTVLPRIYFVGRSERAAARLRTELMDLNPAGKYHFIRADLSLLQNVDNVCREIKTKESAINLLFLTSGTMITGKDTPESLYYPSSITYYARIRLIVNLLPLLQKATSLRRVVTVFGGTKEGPITADDLPGRSLAPLPLRGHTASMMTLALESLALEAPDVSFVHSSPGFVRTNLGKDVRSAAMGLVRAVFKVVGPMVAVPVGEAGERQLFFATSGRFPARGGVNVAETAGVERGEGVGVARGSDAREGSGVYSVNFDGEAQGSKTEEVVQTLRERDWLYKDNFGANI